MPQAMFIRRSAGTSFHQLEQRVEEASFPAVLTDIRNA
jgi:hypothetical protein